MASFGNFISIIFNFLKIPFTLFGFTFSFFNVFLALALCSLVGLLIGRIFK